MKFILILILFVAAAFPHDKLVNSIWVMKITNRCTDSLIFQPSNRLREYDCEIEYTFHGTYTNSKDTVITIIKDDSHSEDNGKPLVFRTKYLVRKTTLLPIGVDHLVKGRWKAFKNEMVTNKHLFEKVNKTTL